MMAGFCAAARDHAAAIWDDLASHPFVIELAAGTLPPEKFRFYLDQNLLYLPDYARCIALGVAKARDEAELGSFTASLVNITDVEIPHNRVLRDQVVALGATAHPHRSTMTPAAQAYTTYLQATAFRGGTPQILTAIMPCAWSYGDIARKLAQHVADHPVYTSWIRFFGTAEYEAMVAEMRAELDQVVAELGAREWEILLEVFLTACRLERAFWDMAYTGTHWPDLSQ